MTITYSREVLIQILHGQQMEQLLSDHFLYLLNNGEPTYCIFPNMSRIFGVFYKAKVGGLTYVWICIPQKKITS